MVEAIGNWDFGRSVLQNAISRRSFATPIREVEEEINLASRILPGLDPDAFTMVEGLEGAHISSGSAWKMRMYAIPTLMSVSTIKILARRSQSRPPLRHQNSKAGGSC